MLSILNNNGKPYVQMVTAGFSGCRAYRCDFPATAINWTEGIGVHVIEVPMPLLDNGILNATRAFMFKSPGNAVCYDMVRQLADIKDKAGFRLIADYDDQPVYIKGCISLPWEPWGPTKHKLEDDQWFIRMAPLFDAITVTNEYLARELDAITNTHNYVVLPNTVPRWLFSAPRKPQLAEDKTKFVVVGSGCPLHSTGPHKDENGKDIEGQPGDWASAEWIEFIKEGVNEGWMDYIQMGGPNWMLEDIKDKIRTLPWVPPLRFPSLISRLNADVVLAPLVDCVFNKCKSDLRLIEANVCSSAIMCSTFADGPYENAHQLCKVPQGATKDQLKEILFTLGKKDNWNEVIEYGWRNILDNGRITESDQALERYVKLFGSTPEKVVPFDIM